MKEQLEAEEKRREALEVQLHQQAANSGASSDDIARLEHENAQLNQRITMLLKELKEAREQVML